MNKFFKPVLLASVVLLAAACGGNNTEKGTNQDHSAHDHSTMSETPAASGTPSEATTVNNGAIEIESNDQMQFNKSEIKVKAGEKTTITLKHVGKMAKEVMGHNIVILKPGTDIPAFGLEANKAKDTEYIPASLTSSVIAHSAVIGGGEQTSFDVTLEAGRYDFICSFPGHLAVMKGVTIAE